MASKDPKVAVEESRLTKVREQLAKGIGISESVVSADQTTVSASSLLALRNQAHLGLQGAGIVLQPLLDDPTVTDVLVNGSEGVWVDRGNGLEIVSVSSQDFSHEAVRKIAVRLAATCGQRLDDACPIADGTLPDGTRLNAVLPPLATNGALISLRTRKRVTFSLDDLVGRKMLTESTKNLIILLVRKKANVFVSGSTGAGKTTFISAVLGEVPKTERILCLEESVEIDPHHPHTIHLTVRRPNVQNVGGVEISDLVKTAMRMRPDRLVIGECRGAEVRDVISAINTGHEGGWATIHANSAMDVPVRIVAIGALAKMPEETVAAQAAAAIDAVVHVTRENGFRKLKHLAVLAREGNTLSAQLAVDFQSNGFMLGPGWNKLANRLGVEAKNLVAKECVPLASVNSDTAIRS